MADKKPIYKTQDEIELIRKSSLLVGKTLAELSQHVRPGITTLELDRIADQFIRDHGAIPGFYKHNNYPNSICTSVNSAVVHGLPTATPLAEGDIVSVDIGVIKDGFWGDSAYTFAVGEISEEAQQLLDVTMQCLYLGIEQAVAGKRVGDIGYAVQTKAESHGYGVVRDLVGHGLGRNLHEAPEVPNYGRRGHGTQMFDALVIAIEPMINMGTKKVKQMKDGWTIQTADNKLSAHFEHTVVIRKDKAEILSTFEGIKQSVRLHA
ncbi:MAG: type I methionyl aminopeptidase [Flavobacteriales bacterium]